MSASFRRRLWASPQVYLDIWDLFSAAVAGLSTLLVLALLSVSFQIFPGNAIPLAELTNSWPPRACRFVLLHVRVVLVAVSASFAVLHMLLEIIHKCAAILAWSLTSVRMFEKLVSRGELGIEIPAHDWIRDNFALLRTLIFRYRVCQHLPWYPRFDIRRGI